MSGTCARTSRSNSRWSMTTTTEAEKPPLRSACATSSASSLSSSTCNTWSFAGGTSAWLSSRMGLLCLLKRVADGGRLIDDQPIQPDILDRIPISLEVDRLLNVAVGPQMITGDQVPLFFGRGHNDDRNDPGARIALELGEYFQSVDLGQLQIQQHQFRRIGDRSVRKYPTTEEKIQRFLAIAHHKNAGCRLFPPESVQGQVAIVLIVFDQEYVQFVYAHREP